MPNNILKILSKIKNREETLTNPFYGYFTAWSVIHNLGQKGELRIMCMDGYQKLRTNFVSK